MPLPRADQQGVVVAQQSLFAIDGQPTIVPLHLEQQVQVRMGVIGNRVGVPEKRCATKLPLLCSQHTGHWTPRMREL